MDRNVPLGPAPAGIGAGAGPGRAAAAFPALLAARRQQARLRVGTAAFLLAACVALAAHVSEFDLLALIEGFPKTADFLSRLVPPIRADHLGEDFASWYWGAGKWLHLLATTLIVAFLATTLGTVSGGVLSFYASRNLVRSGLVYWITRRFLEVARSVPDLVWALIFVFSFGLGPLSGMLAIAVHTAGAQGKLFAEANENIDMKPVLGIRAAGGRWADEISFGVLPQVLPNFVSYTFWRFEVNVRLATVVGFVGAGGIGMELYESISLGYFDDAGAILLIVAVTVFCIDIASEHLRLRFAGVSAGHP
jgi:phosphonate transport system permease protein